MNNETLSREAIALIKLGEAVGQLGDSEELLREARDQCHKLRGERNLARKLADSAMFEADRYRGALNKIASMDTSQDASPQQCGAVLIAMNALEGIE